MAGSAAIAFSSSGDGAPGPASLPRTLLAATSRGSVHVLELGAAAWGGAW